ncbi:unnamed protein product [Cuscuta campestris]|uniref:Uncharacterized protein n=1 Tax=Cuscuta campestris TaxID=132261 RepID=A0A484LW86_9ASTE|nr:unnamed protein product [Cuscuta campestris]
MQDSKHLPHIPRKPVKRASEKGKRMTKEEAISSSGDPMLPPKSSSPPPPSTPAASSAGASSPAFPLNVGSTDWAAHGSKAGSVSRAGSLPIGTSLSTSAGGSVLGSSQPSCRPWERGDLLRRLSTFKPTDWFGRPKDAGSLACARRGWINVDVDKIECESCGANLKLTSSTTWTPSEVDIAGEDFANKLDEGHKVTCPWRGNSCAESLVQFPPTPPSALVGGFKDRSDGLLQFTSLPIVAASAIEHMRVSRGSEIDSFLAQSQALGSAETFFRPEVVSGAENSRDVFLIYSRAQKLISLCGWEPRWLPNVQDCEEYSAQSARNGCSTSPTQYCAPLPDSGRGKMVLFCSKKKDTFKTEVSCPISKGESRSPLLDCSLCGATVRILDFLTVSRPACFAPNSIEIPETSKKMGLTRGVSAASGISGWIATDGMEKEQIEDHDEATTDERRPLSNNGMDINLTIAGGLSSSQIPANLGSDRFQDVHKRRGPMIGQPSSSEAGNRAASYESRGPSSHKRHLEERGSTADRPQLMLQQADSAEGTVIDRDGDEVNDESQYLAGPSKRPRESYPLDINHSSYGKSAVGAASILATGFEVGIDGPRDDPFNQGHNQAFGLPAKRDSTRVSSVIAMDIFHSAEDSMESVENFPGDLGDIQFPSTSGVKSTDPFEVSELNYSNQAQQSVCPAVIRRVGDIGGSSTNDEEVLNADTATAHTRDAISFGISAGSIGMGASHEAEIHGMETSVHRTDSVVGDVEPIAEITENEGQTGEFGPDPGLMGDYVPEEIDMEDRHGDSQDLTSRLVGRADSGSKVFGSTKEESTESAEKPNHGPPLPDNRAHPSFSQNAIILSVYETSKEEVNQAANAVATEDGGLVVESGFLFSKGAGPPNGESGYKDAVEFDPVNHHNPFCPWVNGNVAAAGCTSSGGSSSSAGALALCGWQLTLDALDSLSIGNIPVQTVESESAASLYKDDHRSAGKRILPRNSFSKSRGGD